LEILERAKCEGKKEAKTNGGRRKEKERNFGRTSEERRAYRASGACVVERKTHSRYSRSLLRLIPRQILSL
jgi:hypothetical protein